MGSRQKKSYAGIGPDGSTLICDSKEEMYFTWWLNELFNGGFIDQYGKPDSINLSYSCSKIVLDVDKKGKIITKEVDVLGSHKYTPDFFIDWNIDAADIFFNRGINPSELFMFEVDDDSESSLVEVKPSFDQQNMTRLAMINIKWAYISEDRIVNLVVPNGIPDKGKRQKKKCLFHETFTPNRFLSTDGDRQPRIIKHPVRNLSEYLMYVEKVKEKYAIQRSVLDV